GHFEPIVSLYFSDSERAKLANADHVLGTRRRRKFKLSQAIESPFADFQGLPYVPLLGSYSQIEQGERGTHEGNNVSHTESELALYGVALCFSMSPRYRPSNTTAVPLCKPHTAASASATLLRHETRAQFCQRQQCWHPPRRLEGHRPGQCWPRRGLRR